MSEKNIDTMLTATNTINAVEKLKTTSKKLIDEIRNKIIGQEEVLHQLLIALFSQGHCILLGVPGLAKTTIIKSLADGFSLSFNRIQFTPDLMPSDITGTEIIELMEKRPSASNNPINNELASKGFRFVKGPIFANIILADEINRTPPKTQSALLQAMQEYKVTVSGVTYELEPPFFVLATQNPIEQEGTYPLPEAQLDRFMFEIEIYYPKQQDEERIVEITTSDYSAEIKKVIPAEDILAIQKLVRKTPVSKELISKVVKFVNLTRPGTNSPEYINKWVAWGASPRASQYLILGAKANALLDGRLTPSIEDVRYVMLPVLRHRIITNFTAEADNISSLYITKKLLQEL